MSILIDSFPGRLLTLENEEYLYFGGTSYLGVQTDAIFQDLIIRSIKKYGSNYGASRKSNVRFSLYHEAENKLANWVGSEACITMSSGYLAGQLVSSYFNTPSYKLFYAPNSHSALFQTNTKPYATYTSLTIALREHIDQCKKEVPVVFIDSIDFSGCNYPSFDILKSLPLESCVLIVDDSHGIGVVGDEGGGVFKTLATISRKNLIVCASLGKAMGLQAGAIFGFEDSMAQLMETDFFGGASPAAPFFMATMLEATSLYNDKRVVLQKNIAFFLKILKNPEALNFMPQYPVFGYSNPKLTEHLKQHHILVTDFPYPTEDSFATSRIVISAGHTTEDIKSLATALNSFS
jgi:7-keto-8-aminopelargonate synthetase-like enzyme